MRQMSGKMRAACRAPFEVEARLVASLRYAGRADVRPNPGLETPPISQDAAAFEEELIFARGR